MKETPDCIFCKLLAGELEVSMVYQDAYCSAFMDIQPINPGHMLVVPNTHATYLAELKEEEGAQMFRVAQRLAKILRFGAVKCEGINFFLADGKAAGQDVFHIHLHVFPRSCRSCCIGNETFLDTISVLLSRVEFIRV